MPTTGACPATGSAIAGNDVTITTLEVTDMHPHYLPTTLLAAAAVAVTLSLPLAAHAEASRAAVLASTCFACHGTDGKSPGAIPSIYGYPAEIMSSHLKAFRAGSRAATVMDRHATGYTDEEIELIASYLEQLGK
ncbi:MAG TPA: c-type cytochrome [Gammaproteobacteria bacterium]